MVSACQTANHGGIATPPPSRSLNNVIMARHSLFFLDSLSTFYCNMDNVLGPTGLTRSERHILPTSGESFSTSSLTLTLPKPKTTAPNAESFSTLQLVEHQTETGTGSSAATLRPVESKSQNSDSGSGSGSGSGSDMDTFPEGGRQAWATVFASFCIIFITQGSVASYGAYQDFYTRTFLSDNSPSKIAWIGSMQAFLIFFLGLPAGKLFDDGYLRPLIITGSAIYIISYFMLSLAKPHHFYQVFLAQGLGVGLGMGLLYVPAVSICLHYFKRRRALALGITSLGASIGAIVQTIGLDHLLNGRVGFAWGVRIFGFIFFVLIIIGNVLMRPRLPPKKLRKDNTQKPNIKKVLTDVPFLIATFAAPVLTFAIYFPFFYLQLFAILHGISTNLAFYSISILNGAAIIGRIGASIIADRYGPLNTVIVSAALLGISSFTMIKATTPLGLVLFTVFYGILSGACVALAPATVSAYIDTTSDLGFALGFIFFIQSFFTLIAGPVAGQILHAPQYRWNTTIIVVSVLTFTATFFLGLSRVLLFGRKKTWRV